MIKQLSVLSLTSYLCYGIQSATGRNRDYSLTKMGPSYIPDLGNVPDNIEN